MITYPFATGDLLEHRHTYAYSSFGGPAFLDAWRAQRMQATTTVSDVAATSTPTPAQPTDGLLDALAQAYSSPAEGDDPAARALARLIQRFEVSKRVHGEYGADWRPVDPADYRSLGRYLRFAEVLALAWGRDRQLPALNALLKCVDILCSRQGDLACDQQERLVRLIRLESTHVEALARQIGLGNDGEA